MSDVDDLLGQLPFDQIADELGVTPDQARAASAQALPALLHGLAANADDEAGAASIGEALGQHAPLQGTADLGRVDTADGAKIVGHVFGDNADAVVDQLAGTQQAAGLSPDLTRKLLSILAPIVLSYLAGKLTGKLGGKAGGIGATVLQEILKGSLGGGSADKGGSAGDILGDLLGGLLGRGRR
ncbi:hypothetical protein BJ993_004130 [Nocardioides aromaticivorans]|uniref:DUF937 domain-containing protein n=1 Tax=Nocardioides aromaticivorans TaxID=200618 RepID=A0A7Y9ZN81_9ACTN|nr:DUF937 domain-containing protein [Nocardioides aromaticivorans]NYI47050.1 hypothetical protein [Nocardioides aromaticivorans]